MTWSDIQPLLRQATLDTLKMVGVSALIATLIGIPLGVLLILTDRGGLWQCRPVYQVLGLVVNIGRSLPFIILIVVLIPFTRAVVGSVLGWQAAALPLAISAIPFLGRLVETSVREVDRGLVEAAQSMGARTWSIVARVFIPEALPSIISGITLTVISLIGYSAIAGAVGAGGLGDVAIQYGYQRYQTNVLIATMVILIVMVAMIQAVGSLAAKLVNHR